MENNIQRRERRGYEVSSFPSSSEAVLVKANIDTVSSTLASLHKGKLKIDIAKKNIEIPNNCVVIYQLKGHLWSMFLTNHTMSGGFGGPKRNNHAQTLSKELHTLSILLEHEDTSGWTSYLLFKQGKEIEGYSFGYDYSVEIEDAFDEIEKMKEETTSKETTQAPDRKLDIDITDGEDQILFYSKLRKVAEVEVKKRNKFIDAFFISQDAYMPDFDFFAYPGEKLTDVASAKDDFIRIDLMQMPK